MKNICNYNYISFDIFDTLVKREVSNPNEIFNIVENKYNLENRKIKKFKKNRLEALKIAASKLNDKEEVNLSEIYNELRNYYSKSICEKLYNLEIETEIN